MVTEIDRLTTSLAAMNTAAVLASNAPQTLTGEDVAMASPGLSPTAPSSSAPYVREPSPVDTGAPAPARVKQPMTVVLKLNGRDFAQAVIPDINNAIENDGLTLTATRLYGSATSKR